MIACVRVAWADIAVAIRVVKKLGFLVGEEANVEDALEEVFAFLGEVQFPNVVESISPLRGDVIFLPIAIKVTNFLGRVGEEVVSSGS